MRKHKPLIFILILLFASVAVGSVFAVGLVRRFTVDIQDDQSGLCSLTIKCEKHNQTTTIEHFCLDTTIDFTDCANNKGQAQNKGEK